MSRTQNLWIGDTHAIFLLKPIDVGLVSEELSVSLHVCYRFLNSVGETTTIWAPNDHPAEGALQFDNVPEFLPHSLKEEIRNHVPFLFLVVTKKYLRFEGDL